MNININDDKFQEKERKAIFNDGKTGFVNGCTGRITKRTSEEPENGPKYKIYFKDPSNGAEVNRAYFPLRSDASEAAQQFFVKDMKHIMKQCGFTATKTEFPGGAEELLDYVMVNCKDLLPTKKWAVGVCYGTKKKPNSFLEVDGYWGFKNEELIPDGTTLTLSDGALLNRIDPSNISIGQPVDSTEKGVDSDLPF